MEFCVSIFKLLWKIFIFDINYQGGDIIRNKKYNNIFLTLFLAFAIIITALIFKSKSEKDFYREIQKSLSDVAIKDGVVVDDSKDKEDIKEKKFKEITQSSKKKRKGSKYPYYTMGDIDSGKYRYPKVIQAIPPKGMNIDNIDQTPDYIDKNVLNVPFKNYVVFYPQH